MSVYTKSFKDIELLDIRLKKSETDNTIILITQGTEGEVIILTQRQVKALVAELLDHSWPVLIKADGDVYDYQD